ncbi:NUDIX domain-containing protein [Streptomyces sp. PanSC9]|uniref:NUDIX domain-containing protein n=1 Tax=Streptomyces sp. PanSC9 TaxID=1520461 RepID=UPI00288C409A|nr:NUDIX domain-containing protein [Streptomyces sp. PanSC9]
MLSAPYPRHGGKYLFLPGSRREADESPEECARREPRKEAGIITAPPGDRSARTP